MLVYLARGGEEEGFLGHTRGMTPSPASCPGGASVTFRLLKLFSIHSRLLKRAVQQFYGQRGAAGALAVLRPLPLVYALARQQRRLKFWRSAFFKPA